jgi:hypothetical protein
LAQQLAPEIPRELDLEGLQLLTPGQVQAVTGLPVAVVDKKISLGLAWADIAPIYRLPGYASPVQFLITGLVTRVRGVGSEIDFLSAAEQQQPGSGAEFVAAARSLGMRAFADPANTRGLELLCFAGCGRHLQHDSDRRAVAACDFGSMNQKPKEVGVKATWREGKLLPCSKTFFDAAASEHVARNPAVGGCSSWPLAGWIGLRALPRSLSEGD